MNRYLEIVRKAAPASTEEGLSPQLGSDGQPSSPPDGTAPDSGSAAPAGAAAVADSVPFPSAAAGADTSAIAAAANRTGSHLVTIGQEVLGFSIWNGERLGTTIAFDTETTLIQGLEIPQLVLASASDGNTHCVIPADQVGSFLRVHKDADVVCHNTAFDFWVVDRHLRDTHDEETAALWWEMVDRGGVHDTMLLDMLIQLARTDAYPVSRNLGQLAREYADLSIDKTDPYRLRYGEIIGKDLASVDPGFLSYAVKDAIATHRIYDRLVQIATNLVEPFRSNIQSDAISRFGLLTETVQVRAAIALAAISRHGVHLDQTTVSTVREQLHEKLAQQVDQLQGMACAEGLFKTDKNGQIQRTPKAQIPCMSKKRLEEQLLRIAEQAEQDIPIRRTPKGAVSTSAKVWSQYSDVHPFIGHWVKMTELAKLCQFFGNLKDPVVHPRYTTLVRTGRTSCSSPNIQQLPRSGGFREMILASPGHYVLAVDYSFVELRTLAAVCEFRYGSSTLADVIRAGTDPHVHTAAMFANMGLDDFQRLKVDDPQRHATLRQRAKALNFGIPGGLGAASLVAYARSAYGVDLTIEEAQEFRQRLIGDVYPELGTYLSEDTYSILADNLKSTPDLCRHYFRSPALLSSVRRIVSGKKTRTNGEPYKERWVNRVWTALTTLCKDSGLRKDLKMRKEGERLLKQLFWSPVATLTGRLRGRVSFSQNRNTPFQGLAADGAKLALWKLVKSGYRVVAFIHDEMLIELPVDCDHAAEASRIEQIMCESMELVTGSVPVACEYSLSTRWYKQATAVLEDGKLGLWEPENGTTSDLPRHVTQQEYVTKPAPVAQLPAASPNRKSPGPVEDTTVRSNTPSRATPKAQGRLTKPVKWHGGKHYLAKRIISLMPAHTHYVEPFFGGGSVLLEKDPVGVSEVVNDIHGGLTNFWRVLQNEQAFVGFQRLISAVPFSQEEWRSSELLQYPDRDLDVRAAVAFFVRCRQSRAGKFDTFATLSKRRTRRDMNEQASAWMTAVEGLPTVAQRLRRVVILNDDALAVIRREDTQNSLFYLDPPYLHDTRVTTADYAHEMDKGQHRELLTTIKECKGKVMLSGYPNDLYERELKDWKYKDIIIDNKASSAKKKPKKTERIWMNF
jgi:DNA adenine methylase